MSEQEIAAFKAWLGQRDEAPKKKKARSALPGVEVQADAPPAKATIAAETADGDAGRSAEQPAAAKLSRRARRRLYHQEQQQQQQPANLIMASDPVSKGAKRRREQPAADAGNEKGALSKRAKRRRQKDIQAVEHAPAPSTALSVAKVGGALGKAAARLQGSRFRWLNDTLYSITGKEAKELYEKDPTLASVYHEGFRLQASKWPHNPLDGIIRWLQEDVPRENVIGDFGCGDARLALELKGRKIHSLDLVKINERVTPCNLAAVPLEDQSLDVAIFCLALMGTDWPSFLQEARRCLRPRGLLHIAEVESRMADFNKMIKQVEDIGFKKVFFKPGSFFVEMRFEKSGSGGAAGKEYGAGGRIAKVYKRKVGAVPSAVLAGCTYRKR